MPREIDRKYGSGKITTKEYDERGLKTKNPGTKKRTLLTLSESERSKRRNEIKKRNRINAMNKTKNPGIMGNPAVVETYEDARENQMINRDIPTMKKGGEAKTRGMGCAIKGGKFEGVF